jgi:hypothetical protein
MATLNSTAAITPAVAIIRGSSQSGVPMDCRRDRVCVEGCTKNLPRCNWVGVPQLTHSEAVEGSAESAADVKQKAQQQIPAPVRKVMQQSSERNKKGRENRAQGASEQHAASTCHSVPKGTKYPR